jgi:hypothetical protein
MLCQELKLTTISTLLAKDAWTKEYIMWLVAMSKMLQNTNATHCSFFGDTYSLVMICKEIHFDKNNTKLIAS